MELTESTWLPIRVDLEDTLFLGDSPFQARAKGSYFRLGGRRDENLETLWLKQRETNIVSFFNRVVIIEDLNFVGTEICGGVGERQGIVGMGDETFRRDRVAGL